MLLGTFNGILWNNILRHPIVLKEFFPTPEVITQPPGDSHSFLFISMESCSENSLPKVSATFV